MEAGGREANQLRVESPLEGALSRDVQREGLVAADDTQHVAKGFVAHTPETVKTRSRRYFP